MYDTRGVTGAVVTKMIRPSNNPITLPFGGTEAPYSLTQPHLGTDFAYLPDEKIYAPFTGSVLVRPNNGKDGNAIYTTDQDGRFHGFLHMQQFLVSDKQLVQEGQPIGLMGDTGYAQGRHLHWAVKVSGTFIDPMTLISEEKEQKLMNKDTVYNFYREAFHRDPTDEEYKTWVGKPMEDLFYGGGKAQYAWLWEQLEGTQKALDAASKGAQIDPKILNLANAIADIAKGK